MRYLTADYTKRINKFHFATTESCSTSLPLSIYNNLLSEHCNKVVPKSSSKRVDCKLCVSQSCYEFNFRYEKLLKTHVHFQAKTTKNIRRNIRRKMDVQNLQLLRSAVYFASKYCPKEIGYDYASPGKTRENLKCNLHNI